MQSVARLVLLLCLTAAPITAQTSPQELATAVFQKWAGDSTADFAAVYPFRDGRNLHASIVRGKLKRPPGLASVIRTGGDRAILLLAGVPLTNNSGDDTIYSTAWSGGYEAVAEAGKWKLDRRIPLDDFGQIVAQRIKVSIRPGHGVDVEDRMTIRVAGSNGFAARLNHGAKLQPITIGGREVPHQFGGGLLWIDAPRGQAEAVLRYSLEVETAPDDPNSGCFQEAFGHIRNQYFWHPAFDVESSGDKADFEVEVQIPREYKLSSSLPQTEQIDGRERIVKARTVQKTSTLTLAYDREWKVVEEKAGGVRIELFVTPAFKPEPAAVVAEFRQVHDLLASQFGEPSGGYVAIVELRGYKTGGWRFNSNQSLYSENSPGYFSKKEGPPSAHLGHEIAHFWTSGAGPAANFLREGWAMYVESLVVDREFGPDTEQVFWRECAQRYFKNYDGRYSILEQTFNWDLHYDKGAWIFRMLEEAVGAEAFRKAMTEYSRRSLAGPATWETLADCFRKEKPDFDARGFMLPWLKEKSAPRLSAQVEGRAVTIRQTEPNFMLPVQVEGRTAQGVERRLVWIRGSEAVAEFSGPVSEIRIDPDELLLLRR